MASASRGEIPKNAASNPPRRRGTRPRRSHDVPEPGRRRTGRPRPSRGRRGTARSRPRPSATQLATGPPGAATPPGKRQRHPHDRDRLVADRHHRGRRGGLPGRRGRPVTWPARCPASRRASGSRRSGWRQRAARSRRQPVAQLDRGQRVEAQLPERRSGSIARPSAWPSTAAALRADQVRQQPLPLGRADSAASRCRGPPRPSPRSAAARRRPAPATRPPQRPARLRARLRTRPRVEPGQSPAPAGRSASAGVEQGQALRRGQRAAPPTAHAAQVGRRPGAGHAALASVHRPQAIDVPGSPRPRRRCSQRVEERVGGGVVGLPGAAEQRRRRRRTARTRTGPGPGSARAGARPRRPSGASTAIEPLRGQRADHPVVEDPGGVHHRGQRVLRRTAASSRGQRLAGPQVARRDVDARPARPARRPAPRRRARPGRGGWPAAGAGRRARSGQVPGQRAAQRAGPAGDQHRARRPGARRDGQHQSCRCAWPGS